MKIEPMLAELALPFDSERHIYEMKYNGIRIIGICDGESVKLQGRSGADFTLQFPEVVEALRKSMKHPGIVDGEVVSLGHDGLPAFNRIQQRFGRKDPMVIKAAMAGHPAVFMVFDVISVLGQDVTIRGPHPATLLERKSILERLVVPEGAVRLSPWVPDKGIELFEKMVSLGQEGIMAKTKSGLYIPGGRVSEWQKIKVSHVGVFTVGGYTRGTGWRSDTFGALALGVPAAGGKLRYVGNSGSGFTLASLKEMYDTLQRIHTGESPFLPGTKVADLATWVKPVIQVDIKYADTSKDGQLIWPIFKRISVRAADMEQVKGGTHDEKLHQGSLFPE